MGRGNKPMLRIAIAAIAVVLLGLVRAGSASTQEAVEQLVHDERGTAPGLQEQALAAMEALREEIATLSALKHAQAALLALNRAGSEAGEAPATLAAGLCDDPAIGAWCPLLPATFGTGERPGTAEHPDIPTAESGHD